MGRLYVYQCLVCRVVFQQPTLPRSNVLGVDYTVRVAADTEFPKLMNLELFVRFVYENPKPTSVMVTVTRLDAEDCDREEIFRKRFDLPFTQQSELAVMDRGLKMNALVFPGEGTYIVRILRQQRRWNNSSRVWADGSIWRVLGSDRFYLERA